MNDNSNEAWATFGGKKVLELLERGVIALERLAADAPPLVRDSRNEKSEQAPALSKLQAAQVSVDEKALNEAAQKAFAEASRKEVARLEHGRAPVSLADNPKVDVGYASPKEVEKAEQRLEDAQRASSPTLALEQGELAAKFGKVLSSSLAMSLAQLGHDTQDPDVAKRTKTAIVAKLGDAGFAQIKKSVGVADGVLPTGDQLRKAVLILLERVKS